MVALQFGLPNGERGDAQFEKMSHAFFEALNLLLRGKGVPLAIYNDGRLVWDLTEEGDDENKTRINLAKYHAECVIKERRALN